jgi:4'-phosphopantetheinyl transferase
LLGHKSTMLSVPWQTVTIAPPIASGDLHIWRYALEVLPELSRVAESLLSSDELARAARFHFPIHRGRYVAGRAQLRRILASYLKIAPASITFTYSEFGKPAVPPALNPAALAFNVSHSESLCVVAVSHIPLLGIDVERVRSDFGGEEVAQSNFAPAEFRELSSLPTDVRPQAFFNCWTRKEAYVKALGAGLQTPLDGFEVSLRPGDPARFLRGAATDWKLHSFAAAEGFQAAIAYRGDEARLTFCEAPEGSLLGSLAR